MTIQKKPTRGQMAEWVKRTYGHLLTPENAWDEHSREFLDVLEAKLQDDVWDTLTMGLQSSVGPKLVSMTRQEVEAFVAAGGPPVKRTAVQ
jgi:hypothetical protein